MPHSEIRGSKLILSSSRLIAEYHVLHRLLLPRHPPNALLALDLIQKKTGFRLPRPTLVRVSHSSEPKAYFPAPGFGPGTFAIPEDRIWLVYLTWIVTCFAVEPQTQAHCLYQHETDVYLSIRCQFVRLDGETVGDGFTVKSKMVERSGIEPLTPCLQSRCSPS